MDIDDIDQRKELKQIYIVEYDYYKSLSKDEKHLIYDQESKIKKFRSSEIPIRFKILKLPCYRLRLKIVYLSNLNTINR